jgi:hypothetical protein
MKKMKTTIDLSSIPTCELHAKLAKREGVRELSCDNENTYYIYDKAGLVAEISGPARIIINKD